MAMNKEFADWYRAASLSPSPALLEARWNGIDELARSLNKPNLAELLRIFSRGVEPYYQTPEFIDAGFRKHDVAFPAKGNGEELRVLAGAILRQSIELSLPEATATALGMQASTFRQSELNAALLDHLNAAKKFSAQKGDSVRNANAKIVALKLPAFARQRFDELLPANVFNANQTPQMREPLFNLLNEIVTHLNSELEGWARSIRGSIQSEREELNMLWWLQAKLSRYLGIAFSEVSKSAAAIVFPFELADLTQFVPGPDASLGLLVEALSSCKNGQVETTLADAVNSTPRDWRETVAAGDSAPEHVLLCPISLALARSLDTDGEHDWYPVYRKLSSIAVDQPINSVEFAMQVYTERLFSRAFSEI